MTDDLLTARRLRKAAEILRDPDHLGHTRLADELDSWIDLDDLAAEDECSPYGITRPALATLPDWGRRRGRLIASPLL